MGGVSVTRPLNVHVRARRTEEINSGVLQSWNIDPSWLFWPDPLRRAGFFLFGSGAAPVAGPAELISS